MGGGGERGDGERGGEGGGEGREEGCREGERRGTGEYFCLFVQILVLELHIRMYMLFIRCTMRCEIWAQPAELPR